MKKSLLLGFLTAVLLSAVLFALPAGAADTPSARIAAKNCSFTDTVCLVFYGDFQNVPAGAETGILLWRNAPAAYTYENAEERLTVSSGTAPFEGVSYPVYAYHGLYAKNMTDAVYAVPYIKDGETVVYGEVLKYSILRYAYQILGYLGEGSGNESMKTLVREMLDYGAAAQNYFGYRTDALATDRFYQVTVENGVLSDGTKEGLYKPGASLTLTAVMPDGETFDHWEDGAGNNIGTNPTLNITMDSKNAGYTAAAAAEVPADTLAFVSNGDGTCYVSGIGTVTGGEVVVPQISPAGDTVTGIGEKAFYNCTAVTGITLPNTIKTIGTRAFSNCWTLTEFTIPESVTSIGTQIFYESSNLKTIYYNADCPFNDNMKNTPSVDHVVFGGKTVLNSICLNAANIKTVEILDGVTSIGNTAFNGCSSLTSVIIPDSVKTIGDSAFGSCTSLTLVTIPDGVTSIGSSAFYGTALTSVIIPNSVKTIGDSVFRYCTSLISVTIPNGVTSIGKYAFNGCSALTSVTIPNSVTSIGYGAFIGCSSLTSVIIPGSVTTIGDSAFAGCTYLTTVTIQDGVTIIIPNYAFENCSSLTSVIIPNSVKTIGDHAFENCTSLTSVNIPNSVTSIGYGAFSGCSSLISVTIPDSITNISNGVFESCASLSSVTIPGSVTSIGSSAFYGTALTSVIIPDSVKTIGDFAFEYSTSMTSIDIPDSVTSIGNAVFFNCFSLKNIYYSGTKSQWNNITKGSSWNSGTDSYTIHCTDGDISK